MVWELLISESADKQLGKLDKAIERKIRNFLEDVCQLQDPSDRGHPLTGPWAGFHRYRVGQIRIIVEIDRHVVTVTVLKVRLPDPHQAQVAKMMESRMAPCGSGILPLLVCQSPRWRFNKVPLGIPRGSGNLNLLLTIS